MLNGKGGCVRTTGLVLSHEAIERFRNACTDKEVEIEIKVGGKQVCSVVYSLTELESLNTKLHQKTCAIVERFLNELPRIRLVQNKM